jgi:ABC-type Na+ efflux pump permease subunit
MGRAATTAQLVAAVIAQQQDLINAGKKNPRANVYRKDPQWAQGLMATAQDVEAMNSAFINAVNKLGEAGENFESELKDLEKAAKQVSSVSQKLVAQSKQKSDPGAPSGNFFLSFFVIFFFFFFFFFFFPFQKILTLLFLQERN